MISGTLRTAVVGVVLIGFSGVAAAEDSGFFVGASGIGTFVEDAEGSFFTSESDRTAEFDTGYGGALHLGYDFGGILVGVDAAYRNVEIDSITGTASLDGDVDVFTGLAFVGYEYDTEKFDPFVRVGGGVVVGSADVTFTDTVDAGAAVDEEDTVVAGAFAVQAGLAYNITESLDLVVRYEFLRTIGAELDAGSSASAQDIEEDINAHSVMVGVQFQF